MNNKSRKFNLPFDIENLVNENMEDLLDLEDISFGPVPPIVTSKAPNFVASAVLPDNSITDNFELSEYIKDSYGLILFYPADFTFVCPTEIIAHNNRIKDFNKRNVKLLGVSIDSKHAHQAWKRVPIEQGGIGNLHFPLVSDINKSISRSYRVLNVSGVSLRASYLIDKKGIIRHLTINDLPIGRNVEEILRVIDALQYTENHNVVCPANWENGKEAINENSEDTAKYIIKNYKNI